VDDDDSARQDAYLRGKWERLLKDRNPVFDIAKALMMLWVVWGHLALYKVEAIAKPLFARLTRQAA